MGKTKTKSRSVGDSPKPPITIRSTNPKILDDNIAKLEKAIQAGDVSANPSGTAEEILLSTIGIDGKKYELGPSAENTSYDNTDSGLTATDTQAALDEIVSNLEVVDAKNAYHVGDTFQSGYVQIMGLINSESRFETYVILPKPVGDDVNGVSITGTINNIRADGTQFTTFTNFGGSLNSRDGILNLYVDGTYTGHNLQAGQVAITSLVVTFVHNE